METDDLTYDDAIECKKRGYSVGTKSNGTLFALLQNFLNLEFKDTYATNLFPFIKQGSMSARISSGDMRMAARTFTLPIIKILEPKIAIALGRQTYECISKEARKLAEVEGKHFDIVHDNLSRTRVFHQPHPAARISNESKESGWREMADFLRETL